jgi:hypothetical protein
VISAVAMGNSTPKVSIDSAWERGRSGTGIPRASNRRVRCAGSLGGG